MRRTTAALMAVAMLSGCSFMGVRGPSSAQDSCTTSVAAPVIDTVVATAGLVAGAALLASASSCNSAPDAEAFACAPPEALGALAIVAALPYGISALWGYGTVSECKSFNATHRPAVPPPPSPPPRDGEDTDRSEGAPGDDL